ncbi:nucleotidyltransferase [Schaedlerella arabinosiphila]|uniref:Nucleotidyltransferase n=2 Tax=Schaedlerella arabinosiphila TaxID=2044587 RepID=A0A9X5H4K5_9FIRM|nr:UTP--glucose-1-phosphate uridylyltransferase [Schaedlerella arabinosiphila]NDO68842.1 nucleotidyltransferase [Schaedlerella arabinosiphila]
MDSDEIKKYTGSKDLTLVESMQKIDLNSAGLIYIVDECNRILGTLTDGDIRRWIIKTGGLQGTAEQIMNKNPKVVYQKEAYLVEKILKEAQVSSVPIVNTHRQIINIVFQNNNILKKEIPASSFFVKIPIIVMAGGKGTRLYPYTKILPKPLIPIGDVPILERILDRFYQYGSEEFFLTVNYKKEMIKSYFSDLKPLYKIHYIEESVPLGTAGSIRLIKQTFDMPVMITNCDILIEADFKKVIDFHMESGNDMTIVSSLKNTPIPYGVLHTKEQGIITSMEEKPQLSYFINTGMYIVNPEFLEWIPENRVFHMIDLAEKMIKNNKKVGMYPISENSFLDMGEFEEMKKMEKRINSGNY